MQSKFVEHPVKPFAINLRAQVLIRTNPCKLGLVTGPRQLLTISAHMGRSPVHSVNRLKETGRPLKIQDRNFEYILNPLEANPVLYLDEIQHQILSAYVDYAV